MTTVSSICYHYLERQDQFRRIFGHDFELFKNHLDYFKASYNIVNPEELVSGELAKDQNNLLLTFDDGLKEHLAMADYLESLGVRGVFAVPTCVLRGEPSNPQIIHFGTAFYGIRKFYEQVEVVVKKDYQSLVKLLPEDASNLDLMALHQIIKNLFKQDFPVASARKILLVVFRNYLAKDFPNFVKDIHLTASEIKFLSDRGHTIAVHSDTHPVIQRLASDEQSLFQETVESKQELERVIGKKISFFAYPFGREEDVLFDDNYLTKSGYQVILTTYQKDVNFNKLNLGRYCSQSGDNVDILKKNLWNYQV